MVSNISSEQVTNFVNSDNEGKLEFANLNAFVRKLVYQELEDRFDSKLFLETNQRYYLVILLVFDFSQVCAST